MNEHDWDKLEEHMEEMADACNILIDNLNDARIMIANTDVSKMTPKQAAAMLEAHEMGHVVDGTHRALAELMCIMFNHLHVGKTGKVRRQYKLN